MNVEAFLLAGRWIGPGRPCLIVGEVAQAHDGSLGMAHAFIDAIAAAGADAVKFQTHIAEAESTPAEPWRVAFSRQDASRYAYWKRMEFSPAQWAGLKEHAESRGLVFLSSPFSCEAVALLERLGVAAWKIPSGEIDNPLVLEAVAQTGKPVILSSGLSTFEELDTAAQLLRRRGVPFAMLQCTTAYPCPPEQLGLAVMRRMRLRYGCPVGLSDHSGVIYAGLAAATLGASILEVHVTFSREMFGPDTPASLTTDELRRLVEGVRFIERAMAAPADKEQLSAEEKRLKTTFGKSLWAKCSLPAGAVLRREHLCAKKPVVGVPARLAESVLGRRLARPIAAGSPIVERDLEPREGGTAPNRQNQVA